ncbi:MAG: hypothetical protein AB1726_05780, partial [Planctomycetota bacterium]
MMRIGAWIAGAALLAGGAGPDSGPDPAARPGAEALAEIVRLRQDGKGEEALAAARALLAGAEERGLGERQRAALHFAEGLLLAEREVAEPDELAQALPPLAAARALAGPGELRLAAGYDLGVAELRRAEGHRARIPEIAGSSLAPPAGPPAGP